MALTLPIIVYSMVYCMMPSGANCRVVVCEDLLIIHKMCGCYEWCEKGIEGAMVDDQEGQSQEWKSSDV